MMDLAFFEEFGVRRHYNEKKQKWLFSSVILLLSLLNSGITRRLKAIGQHSKAAQRRKKMSWSQIATNSKCKLAMVNFTMRIRLKIIFLTLHTIISGQNISTFDSF